MIKIGGVTVFELKELAGKFKISTNTLRRYIREGRLAGQKVGVRWLISEDAIKQFFLTAYFKPKAPRKK